jgi:hypothetical protein
VASVTATEQEGFIDAAIDELNLNGAPTIANMTGTAGSKTATLTSKQRAAILRIARAVYSSYYKNADGTLQVNVGNIGLTNQDMMSNPTVIETIKYAAKCLRDDGELPYVIFSEVELETTEDE